MNKLWLRLSLSLLLVTLLVIAAVALVVWSSVEASFSQYVNFSNATRFGTDLVSQLERYYSEQGSWQGVQSLLPERGRGEGTGSGSGAGGSATDTRGAQLYVADIERVIVAATQPEWIGRTVADIGPSRMVTLTAATGETIGEVGYLGEQTPGTLALNEAETRFLRDTTTGLLLTALVGGLIVFVVGIALSYSLTRPLQHLTNQISNWQLPGARQPETPRTMVQTGGTEEIRRLGTAFNDLVARLAAGEALRQRLTADVAHELRTPVTVMRGHLEAMMDGVYPLDSAHLAVAYDQSLHLNRLVEDLRLLTLAEADRLHLNRAALDLAPLIRQAVERFAPLAQDHELRLWANIPAALPAVAADGHRMRQVFDNLLSNALRHTPRGGEIEIRAEASTTQVQVALYNQTSTPLDDEQFAHLFDRFWRSAEARERDTGGSGLGLAITRELLRLQGGSIHATRERAGLCFVFSLPTLNPQNRATDINTD